MRWQEGQGGDGRGCRDCAAGQKGRSGARWGSSNREAGCGGKRARAGTGGAAGTVQRARRAYTPPTMFLPPRRPRHLSLPAFRSINVNLPPGYVLNLVSFRFSVVPLTSGVGLAAVGSRVLGYFVAAGCPCLYESIKKKLPPAHGGMGYFCCLLVAGVDGIMPHTLM